MNGDPLDFRPRPLGNLIKNNNKIKTCFRGCRASYLRRRSGALSFLDEVWNFSRLSTLRYCKIIKICFDSSDC